MNENFISIKDAAKKLGVTKLTLRNWDKQGKLVALRHPMNNYRVYERDDIEKIINQIKSGERPVRKVKMKSRTLSVIHLKD